MKIGYVDFGDRNRWKYSLIMRGHGWFGLFRNSKDVIPGRWGFYFFGFEFGSRNPGDKVGLWLKRAGLWPF